MVGYTWFLSLLLITVGRMFKAGSASHLIPKDGAESACSSWAWGNIARMILQKILWTPELGYDVMAS